MSMPALKRSAAHPKCIPLQGNYPQGGLGEKDEKIKWTHSEERQEG